MSKFAPKNLLISFFFIAIIVLMQTSVAQAQFAPPFGIEEEANVTWDFKFTPETAKPGSFVKLTATADIKAPWHIYSFFEKESVPTSFTIKNLELLEKGSRWFSTKGEKLVQTVGDYTSTSWAFGEKGDKAEFHIWLKVSVNATATETKVSLKISWQECAHSCVMKDDQPFSAILKISSEGEYVSEVSFPEGSIFEDGTETTKSADANSNSTQTADTKPPENNTDSKNTDTKNADPDSKKPATIQETDAENSLFLFLLIAAGGAIASLLTPCVFPMIPVTISYFLKLSEKKNTKPVFLSITYVFGIIFTLSFFGLVLALILGQEDIASKIAAMPVVNLIIGAILILFTLSFFGLFELSLPSGIINRLNKIGRNPNTGAAISTFVLGVVFTLTSFACTGPILGSIISIAVKSGDYLRSFLGMFVYSVVFALPFFFLALSPNLLKKLPKSGAWLMKIKIVMGFIIFIFAFYFIWNADYALNWGFFTRTMVLSIWTISFFILGFYFFGKIRFKEEGEPETKGVGAISAVFGILIMSIGMYLGISAISGRPVWNVVGALLPEATYGVEYEGENYYQKKHTKEIFEKFKDEGFTTSQADSKNKAPRGLAENDGWFLNYEEGIQAAKKAGFPVFVDFTGHRCTNCKSNKLNVFSKAQVKKLFKNFVLIELWTDSGVHTTKENAAVNKALLNKLHGRFETPLYVVIDPKTEKIYDKLGGMLSGDSGLKKFSDFLTKNLEKYKAENPK